MPTEHVPLEVKILRDVASLRKLNNNLISVSWMDDFLVDCYMKIYKLVRNDGRRPETAISVPSTSREASVTGDGEELMRVRPGRVSRKEILQKVFALCKPAPTHAKVDFLRVGGLIVRQEGRMSCRRTRWRMMILYPCDLCHDPRLLVLRKWILQVYSHAQAMPSGEPSQIKATNLAQVIEERRVDEVGFELR
jgi:hypothetical protein